MDNVEISVFIATLQFLLGTLTNKLC